MSAAAMSRIKSLLSYYACFSLHRALAQRALHPLATAVASAAYRVVFGYLWLVRHVHCIKTMVSLSTSAPSVGILIAVMVVC